jgi:hypothetical protein
MHLDIIFHQQNEQIVPSQDVVHSSAFSSLLIENEMPLTDWLAGWLPAVLLLLLLLQ